MKNTPPFVAKTAFSGWGVYPIGEIVRRRYISSMKNNFVMLLGALLTLATVGTALHAEPTAFDLARAGDKFVGEPSKDKVVQIRSERSAGTLVPNVWYVVYYDPNATLKAVQVKFGAGQMTDVSRPMRLLEPVTGAERVLDQDKLKVDSDRALAIAKSQPLLANLALTSTQLWLQHGDLGPQWKVKLWAAKLNKPGDQAEVGSVYISAADGSVLRNDLHPGNIN
jgi:hypothetical protein